MTEQNIHCHETSRGLSATAELFVFIHVMVSAGVCFGWKERLHFIPNNTKMNAKLYVETLLPELVQDCKSVLPSGFIFQQDDAQSWLKTGLLPTAAN